MSFLTLTNMQTGPNRGKAYRYYTNAELGTLKSNLTSLLILHIREHALPQPPPRRPLSLERVYQGSLTCLWFVDFYTSHLQVSRKVFFF